MKNVLIAHSLFIIVIVFLILSIDSIAQCQPYLGQTPPGNTPVRLVSDEHGCKH